MNITGALRICDLGLVHEPTETLIIGDTHIGEEEALRAKGVHLPQFAFQDLYHRTQDILDEADPQHIILNGDVKHNFGRISDDEWDNVFTYAELLTSYADLTVIEGNHDVLLEPIAKRAEITIKDHEVLGDIRVLHGHEAQDIDEKTIVLGHEHPAVSIRDGERTEQFKAFLKGEVQGRTAILMPSMNQIREGSDVLQEQLLSPLLQEFDVLNAQTIIVGNDGVPRRFGEVRAIKNM